MTEVDPAHINPYKGLAHADSFEIRVKAVNGSDESAYSDTVVIIDTPITKADGGSPSNRGQVALSWARVEQILGQTYAGGTYSFRYRRFAGTHESTSWRPTSFDDVDDHESNTGTSDTIRNLTRRKVYAVQLRYTVAITDPSTLTTNTVRVHAARDVYVWPSDIAPANGSRVATFPLTKRLPADKTYRYRICEETFSSEGEARITKWKALIDHAFGQWQTATSGLVKVRNLEPAPCAEYTEVIADIMDSVNELIAANPAVPNNQIRQHIRDFLNRLKVELVLPLNQDDRNRAEILLYNDVDGPLRFLADVGSFPQIADDIGYARGCWYDQNNVPDSGTLMCTDPSPPDAGTSDIIIKRSPFQADLLELPAADARFDRCLNSSDNPNSAYTSFLHEAGHALGIGGAQSGGPHSTISDSVMNYQFSEPDCAPKPFDVMAIYALYQLR